MPSPRILAYAFNSAICCPSCTDTAYENGELIRKPAPFGEKRKPAVFDEHNLPDDMTNTNYEPAKPIFSTDDYPDGMTCDDCGAHIL